MTREELIKEIAKRVNDCVSFNNENWDGGKDKNYPIDYWEGGKTIRINGVWENK